MDRVKFLKEITELLEVEEAVTTDTSFEDLAEYDSLAVMSLIALIDENFEMRVSGEELINIKNVKDLIALIGEDHFNSE